MNALHACADHLWQTTAFAAGAALVTLALRHHHARTRYWLWMAASVKFLVPFSFLVSLGSVLPWRATPAAIQSAVTSAVADIGVSLVAATPPFPASPPDR